MELNIVTQRHLANVDTCPSATVLTDRGELVVLREGVKIVVNQLEPYSKEVFQVILRDRSAYGMWYMNEKDAILLLSRNSENQPVFWLLVNWRIPSDQHGRCSVLPEHPIQPKKWAFPKFGNEFQYFELAVFDQGSNPKAEIHGSSICIVSETTAIFWDVFDRPVLKVILLMRVPMPNLLFSFHGDRIALIMEDQLFVVRTVEDEAKELEVEPFTPGLTCFELGDKLKVAFGLTSGETRDFSFLATALSDRNVRLEILLQFVPPGKPIGLKFLSDQTLLLATSVALLGCVRTRTDKGLETYDPVQLSGFNAGESIYFSKDFVVFSDEGSLHLFPNPEKSPFDFCDGSYMELDQIKFRNIKCVCANDKYCVVATSSGDSEKGAIYILEFEDVSKVVSVALKSSRLESQVLGVRLMKSTDDGYALNAFRLGMQFLHAKKRELGVSMLTDAFNAPGLPDSERKNVLDEMMKLTVRQRHKFIERAHLRDSEITEQILKEITELPESKAALKLINARKFDCGVRFEHCAEAPLFTAVSLSIGGDHEQARAKFATIQDLSMLQLLDSNVLASVSRDLSPQVLVKIGHPELENDEWSKDERMAAHFYYEGHIDQVLDVVSRNMSAKWHFGEWPREAKLCDWVDGGEMMQFVAGCCTYFDIEKPCPKVFSTLVLGAKLAKQGMFKDALVMLENYIYPFEFLRAFAISPSDWIKVIEQVEDEDVRKCALYHFISYSPKPEYNAAVQSLPELPGVSEIIEDLAVADRELIQLAAPDVKSDIEPFLVVSRLSKPTATKGSSERVITVTIKPKGRQTVYTEETEDCEFTVTSKFGKSPLKISAAIIRESADTKPRISPSKIKAEQSHQASSGLIQEVTQVEEKITEEDFYDSRDRPLKDVNFASANTLDMTRSVRSFDEQSRTRIDFSAMSRTTRSRTSQSKQDLESFASATYSTQTVTSPRRTQQELWRTPTWSRSNDVSESRSQQLSQPFQEVESRPCEKFDTESCLQISRDSESFSRNFTNSKSRQPRDKSESRVFREHFDTESTKLVGTKQHHQTNLQVSKPYRVGDSDFTLRKPDESDTLERLMETNEFMPLIFRDKRRSGFRKPRPEFSTSQEAPSNDPVEPRPTVIIPEVNDDLPMFHEEKLEHTVLSQDQGLTLSPIQKRVDNNQANTTMRITEYVAEPKSRVIAPKQDSLNTSEFTELEKKTEAESNWMFIEVEKEKKVNIIQPRPNIAIITKIARKRVTSTRDFRDLGVAMTKRKYDHFVALVEGKGLAGVYILNNDMLRMDRIWGRSQDLILCSQARKYFTFNMHQMKLVPSAEQKMSQDVDAVSL